MRDALDQEGNTQRPTAEQRSSPAPRVIARQGVRGLRVADLAAEVAGHLAQLCPTAPYGAVVAAAERLTALLEGPSVRWLSGLIPLRHARGLVREATGVEVGRLGLHASSSSHPPN
ncbi:hypothetical protein OHA91_32240 [Streptomyces erythrochromogenes]|uniref:Uncharacterized protein n=1 Tax=Streptomyces erythrochromogenes TaxID=285574 RepID=A0ABZ1QK32_9ACTN|nr:hypothetical protein [Streptomyces erythrochromogenes]MCX5588317.1 hypothetical protein [Streptomyces erythrochromogenes]